MSNKTKAQLQIEITELHKEIKLLRQSQKKLQTTQNELEESEQRFRALAEASFESIVVSEKGICLDANKSATEMFGYSYDELVGINGTEVIAPESKDLVRKNTLSGYEEPYIALAQRKDGTKFWAEFRGKMFDYKGKQVRVTAIRDISDRKKFEEELMEKEKFYRTVFDLSPSGILLEDKFGNILDVNPAFCKSMQYKREELIGNNVEIVANEENKENVQINLNRLLSGEKIQQVLKSDRKDRSECYMQLNERSITLPNGEKGILSISQDMTEQVEAEQQLIQSEKKYKQLVDNSLTGIYITQNHILKFCNQQFVEIFGYYHTEEIIGIHMKNLVAPDSWKKVEYEVEQRELGKKKTSRYEFKCIKKDKTVFDVEVLGGMISFNGKPAVQGTMIDISKRKAGENALKESEKRFREVSNLTSDYSYCYRVGNDNSLHFEWATGALKKITGFLTEEIHEMGGWESLIYPEDLSIPYQQLRTLLSAKASVVEYRILHKDKSVKWMRDYARPEMDTKRKQVTYIYGAVQDITERKIAENALRESEEKFRVLADQSPNMIFINTMGRIVYANSTCEEIMGYSKEEFCANYFDFMSLISPESIPLIKQNFSRHQQGKEVKPYEYSLITKSGKKVDAIIATKLIDYEGIKAILGIITDITERKQSEEEVSRLATVVEQSVESIVITNKEGTIQYVNPAFEKVTGYKISEAMGKNPRILKSGKHNQQFYRDMWSTISGGKKWEGIIINKRKNGNLYYEKAIIFPIKDPSGDIINYAGLMRDITLERKLENQLQQIQKMEAIGTLSGGIAHDFNNLLTVINGHAEIALMGISKDQRTHNDLLSILNAGKRAEKLTGQLLAFSRKQIHELKVVELNQVIADLDKMLRRLIPEDILMETNLLADLPYVKADPGQIEQIIINLVVNARDAINENQDIRKEKIINIQTQLSDLDDLFVSTHPGSRTGSYILITVSDTGVGMDNETTNRIFEPFFTTKEVNKGTGLGLATVYGIVKQNNGFIYVDSEPGEGSVFSVYWPITEEEPEPEYVQKINHDAFVGTEHILFVEDDEAVRNFACSALKGFGYKIKEAINGKNALELIKTEKPRIDLLITDLIMPEMNGKDLAFQLRKTVPIDKILFVSGYPYEHLVEEGKIQPGINFIQKPYSIKELLKKIREILNRK